MIELQSPLQAAQWLRQHVTGELRTDSRQVQPGDGFIAWPGAATDGRQYMARAFEQGASACLMQSEGSAPWQDLQPADRVAALPQLKQRTGLVADAYYEAPTQTLPVLAVTGTNGKTSTACWLAQALAHPAIGQRCGVVGTLGVGLWPQLHYTGMTTPDPVLLQRSFRQMLAAGAQLCAIEASSIGIAEHRLDGTRIRTAVFTNFTQDHLDYHGSMQAYWAAKRQLFAWEGLRSVVINIDDAQGQQLAVPGADGAGVGVQKHDHRTGAAGVDIPEAHAGQVGLEQRRRGRRRACGRGVPRGREGGFPAAAREGERHERPGYARHQATVRASRSASQPRATR